MMIDKKSIIVGVVTFGVFFGEALIHYNYAILETLNKKFDWKDFTTNFQIPQGKSLLKMATIVMIASTISSVIIKEVEAKA